MTTSYIDQIDARLAELYKEIEKLEGAKEVIMALDRRSAKTLTLKAEPPETSGKITIRQVKAPQPEKPEKLERRQPAVSMPALRKRAMAVLAAHSNIACFEIGRQMGLTGEPDQKRLYYALSVLISEGRVTKKDSRYSLAPEPEPEPEPEPAEEQQEETGMRAAE